MIKWKKRENKECREKKMEAVMAEFESPLLRYAARILNNPVSAEDVVQNVFIKLFKAWPEGEHPTDKLKPWLYRVTHNEAVDYIRKESRLHDLHEKQAAEDQVVAYAGSDKAASVGEKRALVLSLLHQLHPREQQIILLRLEEGLSYKEISAVTGRSEGNVGNVMHHAVKKLSEKIRNGSPSGKEEAVS